MVPSCDHFLDSTLTSRDQSLGYGSFTPLCEIGRFGLFHIGAYTYIRGTNNPRSTTYANVTYSCYNNTDGNRIVS